MNLLQIMQLLHAIGEAWGVGGATVNAILMLKSEKNPEIAPHIMKAMPAISKLVWLGILLLLVSGAALTRLVAWPIDATMLRIKLAVVLILILNGLYLTFGLLPKMKKLAPQNEKPSEEFLKTKKKIKVFGTFGLVLWYLILILSVSL